MGRHEKGIGGMAQHLGRKARVRPQSKRGHEAHFNARSGQRGKFWWRRVSKIEAVIEATPLQEGADKPQGVVLGAGARPRDGPAGVDADQHRFTPGAA